MAAPRAGAPVLVGGAANPPLVAAVARLLQVEPTSGQAERFPDGEQHVDIAGPVRGRDVYVVQPTSPPVDQHVMELALLADACRRAGAGAVTAVAPYFGYARQDRRVRGREAIGAHLACAVLHTAGVQRVVAVDLHSSAVAGFFPGPVEHLSAVPLLADALREALPPDPVVVAPDLGATKLAMRYARLLAAPMAVVHKLRMSGTEVAVQGIIGDVRGRTPVIVDDMISTGGTIEAAFHALVTAGAKAEVTVAATHALMVGTAVERLCALPIRRLVVTDSAGPPPGPLLPTQVVTVAPLLAEAIRRLHRNASLAELRAQE